MTAPASLGIGNDDNIFASGVTQDQLFQTRKHPRAQTADGPGCDLQHPHAAPVYPHLGVHRPAREAQRLNRAFCGANDIPLRLRALARGRDINGLFEVGTIQRIGLVEQRQYAQPAI